uniref:Ig-like domain-containing protein n=1 Tax=Loxodonta africana TaxID=9785 RepID=G3U119_LOXAF
MGPALLCLVILCFLGAGSTDTEVTQTPAQLVRPREQKAKMDCVPINRHNTVLWYRKKLGEELKFLISFQNQEVVDKSGMPDERFSAQCPRSSLCNIEIRSTEPGDSGVYFCASS